MIDESKGFTYFPHLIADNMDQYTGEEIMVFMYIMRCLGEERHPIDLHDLHFKSGGRVGDDKGTGLEHDQVVDALDALEEKDHISVSAIDENGRRWYTVNWDLFDNYVNPYDDEVES